MPATTTTRRPVGSKVSVDDPKYPGVWIIRSAGPANYTLDPENGGRGLRVPHSWVTDPRPAEETGMDRFRAMAEARPAGLRVGAVVTVRPAIKGYDASQAFIVFADKFERVNVCVLGGDEVGRYWRVPARHCTVIDPGAVSFG